jgi:two-component system, chemotaxis family, protein-glutamate methylesterase/glutaminase
MSKPRIVVIGCSAGGVPVLSTLVGGLPDDLDAAVFIVMHVPPERPSRLHEILAKETTLPVSAAKDGEPIRAGHIVVASADRHLMVDAERVRVTRGPKESRARPAVDVLFRSAAAAHGTRVIGVVLTGALDDGTAGLWAVKDRGGIALVQEPHSAEHASMPESAVRHVQVDRVLPIEGMADEILFWLSRPLPEQDDRAVPHRMQVENLIAREGNGLQAGSMDIGAPSKYTCPDCHGVLVEIKEGSILRFRCHTGHAFSLKTLLAEVNAAIDTGLWDTLRAVEERILLLERMKELSEQAGSERTSDAISSQVKKAQEGAESLRTFVLDEDMFGHLPED